MVSGLTGLDDTNLCLNNTRDKLTDRKTVAKAFFDSSTPIHNSSGKD